MSDAPVEADPLAGYATPAQVRAVLLKHYHAIERAPDERALWAGLNDALRYVFEKLEAGEVSAPDARHLDELFIVTKQRRALLLAGDQQ
jgi:hypothetical protein